MSTNIESVLLKSKCNMGKDTREKLSKSKDRNKDFKESSKENLGILNFTGVVLIQCKILRI